MSLSGNLSFVPIDEVLRLLTRSRQQGSVDVTGDGIYGRVFIGERGVDLATTSDDEDLHRHLVNSGFSDESSLRRITTGETTLAALADSNKPMIELLREMTVESLHQIGSRGHEFAVREGVTTPYASPNSFELEKLLADARAREKDWSRVNEVVPDLHGAMKFRRDLGDRDEVTVKTDDWKILSEIGPGASVSEIADSLGTTEFWAAKVASRLVQSELVDIDSNLYSAPIDTAEEADSDYVEPDLGDSHEDDNDEHESHGEYESHDEYETADTDHADVEETDHEPVEAEAESFEAEQDDDEDHEAVEADPSESWWQEPEDEFSQADEETEDVEPAVVAEGLSEMPSVSDSDDSGEDSDVEEDTEAFLEKVFSELESTPEPQADEGHGLLRRRRMGTLRDFSSDS